MERELDSAPTANELIQALMTVQEQEGRPPDTMTAVEIQEATGWGRDKTYRELRAAKARGEIETAKVWVTNLADIQVQVPGYRLRTEQL